MNSHFYRGSFPIVLRDGINDMVAATGPGPIGRCRAREGQGVGYGVHESGEFVIE
jgi:hypothetical protein